LFKDKRNHPGRRIVENKRQKKRPCKRIKKKTHQTEKINKLAENLFFVAKKKSPNTHTHTHTHREIEIL
jgi:hypothetical protein